MSDDITTTAPDESVEDSPETDEPSTPEIVADPASHEPASRATSEDLPTSGELDDAPVDAVVQEATDDADDAQDMAEQPGPDTEPVAGDVDPELAGIEEPETDAPAAAEDDAADTADEGEDTDATGSDAEDAGDGDLDDLLGMAGADQDEPDANAETQDEDDDEPSGDEGAQAAGEEQADEEQADEEPARRRRPRTVAEVRDKKELMRLPGQWFVVHTYSGYEQRVKDNLTSRVESLGAEDRVHEVVIPTNEVTEFKKGKKQTVQKKFLPGYVLVRMDMDDELWGLVRHTPAVTGFVGGPGNKPVPLSLREVAETLKIPDEVVEETEEETEEEAAAAEKKAAAAEIDLEVGETIRVTTGPFADFTGTIAEINVDQAKLRVMVSVFGRETPLELPFDQVAKL